MVEDALPSLLSAQNTVHSHEIQALTPSSRFDWDLANLAITATIGLLATGVTFVMLVQGLFTAGPGRLRASPMAIGTFARYSRSKLSLGEMRFRTRARVPLLMFPIGRASARNDNLTSTKHVETPELTSPGQGRSICCTPAIILCWLFTAVQKSLSYCGNYCFQTYSKVLYGRDQSLHSYAAGWAKLLEEFGDAIDLLGEQTADGRPGRLLDCDIDYGPSDLTAAPTIGTVECIVQLAAFAGCDSIRSDPDTGYVVAQGKNMQLSFRNHPQLGWTAIFQRFPGPSIYTRPSILVEHCRDLDGRYCKFPVNGAMDRLEHIREFRRDYGDARRIERTMEYAMKDLLLESPGWTRSVPFYSRGYYVAAKALARKAFVFHHPNPPAIIASLAEYFRSRNLLVQESEDSSAKRSRLGHWPWEQYPTKVGDRYTKWWVGKGDLKVRGQASWNTKDWLGICSPHQWLECDEQLGDLADAQHVPDQPSEKDQAKQLLPEGEIAKPVVKLSYRAALICRWFLKDMSSLRTLHPELKAAARNLVRVQLNNVDEVLHYVLGEEALRETWALQFEAQSYKNVQGIKLTEDDAWIKNITKPQDDPPPGQGDSQNGMREFLIFRAVLMAAFLSTAADSSLVVGTELGKKIVQFI